MRIRSRVWALLAAPALLLAACGGDGGDGGTQATAPPQPAKVTVTASASGKQVKFDVPALVKPGATELSLVNNTKEPVEFQLVRLDEGHTLAEFYPSIERVLPVDRVGAGADPDLAARLRRGGRDLARPDPQRARRPRGGELRLVLQHQPGAGGGHAAVQAGR